MGSQYCQPADLVNVINPLALTGITNAQQVNACLEASAEADSYMEGRYLVSKSPLVAPFDPTIVRHCAYIAVYILLVARGLNPSQGGDELVEKNYYKAVGDPRYPGGGYFPGIQRQIINPNVSQATMVIGSAAQLPQVSTAPQRGWQAIQGKFG
jgi:hypothetical protein